MKTGYASKYGLDEITDEKPDNSFSKTIRRGRTYQPAPGWASHTEKREHNNEMNMVNIYECIYIREKILKKNITL